MINAIIQARLNSTRLPKKTFAEIEGHPLIWHIINRVSKSKRIKEIILATTSNKSDDLLFDWCLENKIKVYRGSENNVLERFYYAAKENESEIIVRITADDPFKDPQLIDEVIELLLNENLDFAYNNKPPTFPEGLDAEVFTFAALKKAYQNSTDLFEQEHVTQYFYRNPAIFKQNNLFYQPNISHLRWTIDQVKDLEMARTVYKYLFAENEVFLFNDILNLIKKKPWIAAINADVERSNMYKNEEISEKD